MKKLLLSIILFCVAIFAATPTTSKDQNSSENFYFDWSRITTSTNVIVSSTWTVPVGIRHEASSFTDTRTLIKLSGGTAGTTYLLMNKIRLTDGQELPGYLKIVVTKEQ
jgi:hypothetical protein